MAVRNHIMLFRAFPIGTNLTNKIRDGIKDTAGNIATAFTNIMNDSKTSFERFEWKGVGKNLTNAIRDGINEA